MLYFGKANRKLTKLRTDLDKVAEKYPSIFKVAPKVSEVYTFSLPSGYTCPGAKYCLSFSDKETGKIHDAQGIAFRCFSASLEAIYPSVRRSRWENFETVKGKTSEEVSRIILASLPKNAKIVRVHVGGDFFSINYARGWLAAAKARPDVLFYAYTKSVPIVDRAIAYEGHPENFKIVYSMGGKYDTAIPADGVTAEVVFSEETDLQIDHSDILALTSEDSFGLLIHGVQPRAK